MQIKRKLQFIIISFESKSYDLIRCSANIKYESDQIFKKLVNKITKLF